MNNGKVEAEELLNASTSNETYLTWELSFKVGKIVTPRFYIYDQVDNGTTHRKNNYRRRKSKNNPLLIMYLTALDMLSWNCLKIEILIYN